MALPSIRSIRKFYRELCLRLRREGSPAATGLAAAIEVCSPSWTKWSDLPFFLMVLYDRQFDSILALTNALVASRSGSPWKDLLNPAKTANTVRGDIFDAFVKQSLTVSLGTDCTVPLASSGRSLDAQINIAGTLIGVEASVLGQSRADKEMWDALFEKRRRTKRRSSTGVRLGDPYEAVLRLTEKFLDKVAHGCQPAKCQLLKDHPNLLLISFPDRVSVGPMNRDVSWALDALFSEAPWERVVIERVKDVWSVLERKAIESKAADPADPNAFDSFMKRQLWPQFKRVSGVLLFDDCRFVRGRVNYHCHEANRISHTAMGEVERIMSAADRSSFQVSDG